MNRLISSTLTRWLAKTPAHPNHVTTVALLAGIVSGICMSGGTRTHLLWGALWLHVSFVLDNCDGELARLKSLKTTFGVWYDLIADLIVDWALWIGLAAGALAVSEGPWAIWAIFACLGSTINFWLVVWERQAGRSTSVHANAALREERSRSPWLRFLDFITHNGDVIYAVWILAILGNPAWFLIAGCIAIHGMWLGRWVSQRG